MRGKGLFIGLLATLVLVAFLQMKRSQGAIDDVKTLEVAAGNIELNDAEASSTEPLVHCYRVAGPDQLDIRVRMDFEARTTDGWVLAPDDAEDGEFCVVESPKTVEKRLSRQGLQ